MNLKLHIVAVSILIVVALIVLIATGKLQFGEPPASGMIPETEALVNIIQIDSASWGTNCNPSYAAPKPKPVATIEGQQAPAAQPDPLPLRHNNVLRTVSSMCNSRQRCQFKINPATLGPSPTVRCRNALKVTYRCATLDRLRSITFQNKDAALIDCSSALSKETPTHE